MAHGRIIGFDRKLASRVLDARLSHSVSAYDQLECIHGRVLPLKRSLRLPAYPCGSSCTASQAVVRRGA